MINLGNTSIKDLYLGSTHVSEVYLGSIKVWPEDTPPGPSDYKSQYLTIEAKGAGQIIWEGSTSNNGISISYNDGTDWDDYFNSRTIGVDTGVKVLIKGNCIPTGDDGIGRLTSTVEFDVYGNIHSLLYDENFKDYDEFKMPYNRMFQNLFKESKVVDASNLILPATRMTQYCYHSMFNDCTSLQEPPELPATELYDGCYQNMFYNCTSLQEAPELPATTLAPYCYDLMFINCASLVKAPVLHATELASHCYAEMFQACTSLQEAPELPATTLAERCYSNMFRNCASLVKAPVLPATELANYCYDYMFSGCKSLNEITTMQLAAPNSITRTQYQWVYNVAPTGTIYLNPDITWNPEDYRGIDGIPEGWLVVGPSGDHITFADVDKTTAVNPNDLKAGDKVVIMWGGEDSGSYSHNYDINQSDSGSYILSYRDNILTNLASHKAGTDMGTGDRPAEAEVIDSAVWIVAQDEYGNKALKNYETGNFIQTSTSTSVRVTLGSNIVNIGLQFVSVGPGYGIRNASRTSVEVNNYMHYNYQEYWYVGSKNYWKFYKIGTPQPKDIMFLRTHKDGTTFEIECGESGTTLTSGMTRTNTSMSEISGTTNPVTAITIGDCVETINTYTFYNWTKVVGSLVIPDSVTTINNFAFRECSGLSSLTLGSGLTSIGTSVFNGCIGLTSIYFKGEKPPTLFANVFYGTTCPIYVPLGTGDAYKTAPNWSTYADRIYEYNPNDTTRDDDDI